MGRKRFGEMNCGVGQALEALGDWWTLLIVRDAFFGARRFGDFERNLGIAKNVLAARLEHLVEHGIFERVDVGAEGWQGLLGSRSQPELGGRWIVVLRAPSLADRVRRAGGRATELQMRTWTASAHAAQRRAIAGLFGRGAPVDPEQTYVRVLNGFAASLDPMLLPALERDPAVAGVYPVRASYPAALRPSTFETEAFGPASGRRVAGSGRASRDRAAGARRAHRSRRRRR